MMKVEEVRRDIESVVGQQQSPPALPSCWSVEQEIWSVSPCTRAANDPSVFTIMEKAPARAFSW